MKKFKVTTYFIGDWDNVEDFDIVDKKELEPIIQQYSDEIINKIANEINYKGSKDRIALISALNDYLDNLTLYNLERIKELRNYMVGRFVPYGKLVRYIKEKDADMYDKIIQKIEGNYKDGIFILKSGELEDYLDVVKGLENIIEFCKDSHFDEWMSDPQNKENKKELEIIFDNIVQ